MFQVRVWQWDLTGRLGLALAHPLYIILCRAFASIVPGDFAWGVNVFSGVTSAAALGLIFASMRRLTKSPLSALAAVALLAVTHTYWMHAAIAEVYGLYALALAGEMYLLVRYHQSNSARRHWWLIGVFLVAGLNVSNHLLALLHVPAYGVYALLQVRSKRISAKTLLLMAAAGVIGAGLYEGLVVAEIAAGGGVGDTLRSALFGQSWQEHVVGRIPEGAGWLKCLGYFLLNFPTPLVLLGPLGVYWTLRRRDGDAGVVGVWLGVFAVCFFFAVRYYVIDQYVFFFPCYMLLAVFVGFGVDHMLAKRDGHPRIILSVVILALALLPALVYEIAPSAVRGIPVLRSLADRVLPTARGIPGRDSYAHFLRPRRNADYSAIDFATSALEMAQPDGLIIAGNTVRNPIVYFQLAKGLQRNVHLSPGTDLQAQREAPADLKTIEKFLSSGRRVFIVSRQRQAWLVEKLEEDGRFVLEPRQPLVEICYKERATR